MGSRHGSEFRFRCALIGALALMVGYGYFLWKHDAFRKQGRMQTKYADRSPSTEGPAIGTTLSQIHGRTISGQNIMLDLSHRKNDALLLVFSPDCPYCRVNFHNWRDILKSVPSEQIVWVDLTGTADNRYMDLFGISHKSTMVLMDPDSSNPKSLVATPTTVLLDPHGVVKWAWAGVMSGNQVDELRRLVISNKTVILKN